MAFSLSTFQSALASGGARPSLFDLTVSSVPDGVSTTSLENIKYFCRVSALPPLTVTPIERQYFGRTVKFPGEMGFVAISTTIIQIMSPDYIRGRIAGIYAMYAGGSMALFNFLNGLVADFIDPGYSLAIQGIFFTLLVIIYRNQEVLKNVYSGKSYSLNQG